LVLQTHHNTYLKLYYLLTGAKAEIEGLKKALDLHEEED